MEKRIFGATDGIRGKVGEAPLRPNIINELGHAIAKNTYAKKFCWAAIRAKAEFGWQSKLRMA